MCEAFDEPEGAYAEAALLGGEAIVRRGSNIVAVDEVVVDKILLNALEGREPPRVRGTVEVLPKVVVEWGGVLVVEVGRVEHGPEDISGLFLEADGDQGVEGEGRIAEPGVTVVPVALAAELVCRYPGLVVNLRLVTSRL